MKRLFAELSALPGAVARRGGVSIARRGEFRLLSALVRLTTSRRKDIVVPNGDDAAVVAVRGNTCLAVSKDLFVEDVHFRRCWSSFRQIGYRAIVANISDMAAIGGAKPLYCVVGLALPVDTTVDNVDNLFCGIRGAASKNGIVLLGGDTVRSEKNIVISITIIGEIKKRNIVRRSGAKVGDVICVTGTLGDAAAGLDLLKSVGLGRARRGIYGQLVHSYLEPHHRLFEAAAISGARGRRRASLATAMIDTSDGLAAAVRLIAAASGKGASVRLDDLPLSDAFRKWAAARKKFPWETVLNGGEEYEIVFTARPAAAEKLSKILDFEIIGTVTGAKKTEFLLNGKKLAGDWRGYENF